MATLLDTDLISTGTYTSNTIEFGTMPLLKDKI